MVFNAVPELFANVPIKPGQDEPVGEARNKVLSLVGAVLIVTLPINKIVFLLYLLSVSAHTLPPMKMLCTSFITSLLSSSVSKTQSIDDKIDKDNIIQKDLQEDSAEDSEEELSRSKKQESPSVIEINDIDETKVQLVDHNWSFLSTILPDREEIEH